DQLADVQVDRIGTDLDPERIHVSELVPSELGQLLLDREAASARSDAPQRRDLVRDLGPSRLADTGGCAPSMTLAHQQTGSCGATTAITRCGQSLAASASPWGGGGGLLRGHTAQGSPYPPRGASQHAQNVLRAL